MTKMVATWGGPEIDYEHDAGIGIAFAVQELGTLTWDEYTEACSKDGYSGPVVGYLSSNGGGPNHFLDGSKAQDRVTVSPAWLNRYDNPEERERRRPRTQRIVRFILARRRLKQANLQEMAILQSLRQVTHGTPEESALVAQLRAVRAEKRQALREMS